jgi:hypothetical protein
MSDTVTFTPSDVVAKMRELAAERPDYVYDNEGMGNSMDGFSPTSCFYRHGEDRERAGCIVGQALDRLGYVVPEELEGSTSTYVLNYIFGAGTATQEGMADIRWVRDVQSQQDIGSTWGKAVAHADAVAESYLYSPVVA